MGKFPLLAAAVAVLVSCAVGEGNLRAILSKIPEEDRVDFLRYHAVKGYQLETAGQALDYELGLPDEFSVEVYRTLLQKSVEASDQPLSCIVCWPNGKCADLCDIGIYPY